MAAHALLVGIGEFTDPRLAKLNAPRSDVEEFARILADPARGRFDQVTTCVDEEFQTIREKIATLLEGREPDDLVLLYYSGHGIVARGQRLYLATGQSSFDRPAAHSLSGLELRDWLKLSRAGRQIVILDCCHSGAFVEGTKGAMRAITEDTFGTDGHGQYVLTATDSMQFAYDATGTLREGAVPAKLSRFTAWLVDAIGKGEAAPDAEEITMDAVFDYLSMRARAENSDMTPHCFVVSSSGEFVIARNPQAKPHAFAEGLLARLGSMDWRARKDAVDELGEMSKQPSMRSPVKRILRERVEGERNPQVAEAMLALLARLGGGAVADNSALRTSGRIDADHGRNGVRLKWAALAALSLVAAAIGIYTLLPVRPGTEFRDCAECPAMISVPAGSFEMGSPESEEGRQEGEGPRHRVNIRRAIAVGKYEVTFAEWDACVADAGCGGYKPDDEGSGRGNRPVVNVSWDDAQAYVAWLRAKTGKEYRLLSESEWEYAARAGTTTRYPWGDTADPIYARYLTDNGPAPVGSYPPNPFGLYEMLGNVMEWTQDCYNEAYLGAPGNGEAWTNGACDRHVVRGGFWGENANALRVASRGWMSTGNRENYTGFRVARGE